MGYNPFGTSSQRGGGHQSTVGSGGSLLNTSANPFGGKTGKLGNWDVVGNALDSANPWVGGAKKNADLAAQQKSNQEGQYNDTQGVLGKMDASGNQYYEQMSNAYRGPQGYQDTMNRNTDNFLEKQKLLESQMEGQAKDSKSTYTNTILPKLQGVMEDAKKQAGSAMTLEQAGDPNNAVATGVRNMYDQQAQGMNREGLANAGVLQAMGTQATMGQMGSGGPMTGGQIQALQGANLGQSGAAMARAQQRANDLRQQGIQSGFDQSAAQYGRGQDAKHFYNQSIGNYQSGYNTMNQQQDQSRQNIGNAQSGIFGTQMGQANANLGINTGMAGLKYGLDAQGQNRQLASINDKYGTQGGNIMNQMQANNAQNQATIGAIGSIGGGVAGGMAGRAGGAAAANAYGNGGQGYNTPKTMEPNAGASPYSGYNQQGAAQGGYPANYSQMGGGYAGNNPYR
jgi:hypothetical protein